MIVSNCLNSLQAERIDERRTTMKANFSHQLRRDLGQKVDLTLEVDPLASSSLSSSADLGRVKTSIVDSGEEFPGLFTGCSFSVLANATTQKEVHLVEKAKLGLAYMPKFLLDDQVRHAMTGRALEPLKNAFSNARQTAFSLENRNFFLPLHNFPISHN